MAISIISVSSDSSEESVGTPAVRVILFGTIPTTVPDTTPTVTSPTTHVDTTLTPTEIPTISYIVSPSADYTPASPDTPPSPTHDTPFTKTTPSTQSSPAPSGALCRRVMILGPDDSSRDSTSDSSLEGSSDFHSVASHDSFSRHSSSDHLSPDSSCDLLITYVGPSRKRHRSPMISVLAFSPVPGALSPTDLGMDDDVEGVDEPHPELKIDLVEVDIEACFAFADIIRCRWIDVRVEVETVARDVVKARARDTRVLMRRWEPWIVGIGSAVTIMTERVAELERANKRLRGTLSVEDENGNDNEGGDGGNENGGDGGNETEEMEEMEIEEMEEMEEMETDEMEEMEEIEMEGQTKMRKEMGTEEEMLMGIIT
ncbi:hypothetical protein Tco_0957866 [Tanacetum coccineum]